MEGGILAGTTLQGRSEPGAPATRPIPRHLHLGFGEWSPETVRRTERAGQPKWSAPSSQAWPYKVRQHDVFPTPENARD